MADIINFSDYKPDSSGPVAVTFFAPSFMDEESRYQQLSLTVTVADGDYNGIISAVRDNGGWYVSDPSRNKDGWFIPWPPAGIRVRPVAEVDADGSPA